MALKVPAPRSPADLNMREIRRAFKELDDPWLSRSEVKVRLITGVNVVRHGLSYVPEHWLIADQDANARIWRASATTRDSAHLETNADVNVTLIFW